MFLKHIQFINFKGFSNLELSFTTEGKNLRQQTLLLGENGLGKSNFLKGIALVLAGSNALGDLLGNPDDWIEFGKKQGSVKAIIQTQEGEDRLIELTIKRGFDLREVVVHNQESLSRIDEALKHSDRSYFTAAYGASRRLNKSGGRLFSNSIQKTTSPRRAQNVATLFNADAALQPLAEWAMELDYRSKGKGLTVIKQAMKDVMPGVQFDKIDKKAGVVLFKTKDHSKPVPLYLLSDGYQNVASWIGDLLYRITNTFEDYKKPLETRGLLLIDEVDLHLHPKWQRNLLNFICQKLPNIQMIATSHSPLTAQQADEGELYVLNRENKKVIVKPFAGSPRLMQINQLLMSPMFGLDTDESLEVQKLKTEYLTMKSSPQKKKSAHFKKVKKEVEQLPVQPLKSDVFLREKEALISRLNKKAKIKL